MPTMITWAFLFLHSLMKKYFTFLIFILITSHTALWAQVYIDISEESDTMSNPPIIQLHNEIEPSDTFTQINIRVSAPDSTQIPIPGEAIPIYLPPQYLHTFSDLPLPDFFNLVDSTGKKYFLQFTASWCGPCKMMNKEVFSKPEVIELVNSNFLAKEIDIDDFDGIQITQDLRIKSIPATIIFDCNGRELRRIEGFQYEDMFINILNNYK